MGMIVLVDESSPRLLDVFPEKIGGKRQEDADSKGNVGGFRIVEYEVKEYRQSGTGEKFDEYRHVMNFFSH